MTEKELMQKNIEEFVQLQSYMLLADKDSEVYKAMKVRYNTLKVILTSSGINLTEIDRIKEQLSTYITLGEAKTMPENALNQVCKMIIFRHY